MPVGFTDGSPKCLCAADNGKLEGIKLLGEECEDVNCKVTTYGSWIESALLSEAVITDHLGIVQYLFEH